MRFLLIDGCPFPWVRIGNRTYRKILRKATWVEALETCRDVGGTLMTLDFPTIQQADGETLMQCDSVLCEVNA